MWSGRSERLSCIPMICFRLAGKWACFGPHKIDALRKYARSLEEERKNRYKLSAERYTAIVRIDIHTEWYAIFFCVSVLFIRYNKLLRKYFITFTIIDSNKLTIVLQHFPCDQVFRPRRCSDVAVWTSIFLACVNIPQYFCPFEDPKRSMLF